MITTYSRYYLHRKRIQAFFNTVLFFFFGYNLAILSGNFETLFIGWDHWNFFFPLIAFYRERYLPVKNAFKVFSIYRIGDVGLLLAMWASHHLFHENITFMKLNNYELVNEHLQNHSHYRNIHCALFGLCGCGKIGSDSVFVLVAKSYGRTNTFERYFLWFLISAFRSFLDVENVSILGTSNYHAFCHWINGINHESLAASVMARVQSSVKSQVAYSSISQIGIIFIEIALGFETLALIHFAGNAF